MVRARTTLSSQEDQETRILFHLQNPLNYDHCGGFYGDTSSYNSNNSDIGLMSWLQEGCIGSGGGGSDIINHHHHRRMADHRQDESRTNTSDINEEAAGSSSKEALQEERDHHEGWLQLSIGSSSRTTANQEDQEEPDKSIDPLLRARRAQGDQLLELDLLHGGREGGGERSSFIAPPLMAAPSTSNPLRPSSFSASSLFFQQHQVPGSSTSLYPHHRHPPPPNPLLFHQQEMNWGFRPSLHGFAAAPSSSSSSSLTPLGSYFSHPFQLHGGAGRLDVPVPSQEFRVIDLPRRPFSSIWFMLQASQNQVKEPFLPQISKSYLRIKDGRMSVRLLLKYLVNKLRLDSESEIEITCRGQQLQPILTLQQVRDNIWSPREAVTLLPHSSTTDHIMVLHYARRIP